MWEKFRAIFTIPELRQKTPQRSLSDTHVQRHTVLTWETASLLPGVHEEHCVCQPCSNRQSNVAKNDVRQSRKSSAEHLVLDDDFL